MEEHRQENGYAKFRLEDVGSIPTDPIHSSSVPEGMMHYRSDWFNS